MSANGAAREVVLVSGMHRSGTSALTRVCNILGGVLPEPLVEPAVGNELGHWEPAEVVAMNDRALLASGGEVNSVFPVSPRWPRSRAAQEFVNEVEAYVRSLGAEPRTWFIKDPRISVLADLWREGIRRAGAQPRFLIAFRNPWEVATSLCARQLKYFPDEVWPVERGLALWLTYTLAAERKSRGCPRSFVAYEDFLEDWRGEVGRIYDQLGLPAPLPNAAARAEVAAFLKPEERHARHDALKTRAGLALHVFDLLKDRIADPDGGAAAFDKAQKAFDASFGVLGGYVEALEHRAALTASLKTRADAAETETEQLKETLQTAEMRMIHLARQGAAPGDAPAETAAGDAAADALKRLQAQHEALTAAHRNNIADFKAERAVWRRDLDLAVEEGEARSLALRSELASALRDRDAAAETRAAEERARALAEDKLRQRDAEVERHDDVLRRKDDVAAHHQRMAEAAEAALAASRGETIVAQREVLRLQGEVAAIRRSRSWRLAAPIRAAAFLFGRR